MSLGHGVRGVPPWSAGSDVPFPLSLRLPLNGAIPLPLAHHDAPGPDAPADAPEATSGNPIGYALLFAPFALAAALSAVPLASYSVAWAGSLWVLWLTVSGRVRPLPGGGSALDQVMRPIVLTQVLFASYNFLSSVFYVADLHGFYYLSRVSMAPVVPGAMEAAALAQRYYVLAHAAVAAGMLLAMDYRRSGEWAVRPLENPARAVLWLSLFALVIGTSMGEQDQFGIRIAKIGLVASVLGLSLAIPTRRLGTLLFGLAIYVVNLGSAFLSGWKEEVLVMVVLLAVFLYPYARRTVLLGTPIALVFLLAVLPTYANVFRSLNWKGDSNAEEAAAVAVDEIQSGRADVAANNWTFLTGRISEIGLFVRYIGSFEPAGAGGGPSFYGTTIVKQAAFSMVPRALWSEKPITEQLVMGRVYDAGVASRASDVSAKPQYVVDGYLSAGALGVLLAGLVFGLIASFASRACERWFGGYFWGSGLIYTAMFSVLWKGNTFEFFFNTVFYSFVLLVPLFWLGRWGGLLVRHDEVEEVEADDAEEPVSPRRGLWPAYG